MRLGVFILLPLFFPACHAETERQVTHRRRAIPHLFAYTRAEVEGVLKGAGIEDFVVGGVRRSGEGDRLFIFPLRSSDRRVVVLSDKGELWIEKRPRPLDAPCDQENFRAWYSGGRELAVPGREERVVASPWWVTVDPTCSHFFAHLDGNETALASTHDPSRVLLLAPLLACSIFRQRDVIYLFGHDWSSHRRLEAMRELVCLVLTLRGDSVELTHQVRIPRPAQPLGVEVGSPFYVADLSPFSPTALLVDARDMPLWDRWILLDLQTWEQTMLGPERGTALFLARDILAAVQLRRRKTENGFASIPTPDRAAPW